MSRLLRTYWPSILVVLVILYATWVPRPIDYDSIPPIPYIDKLFHAIMFGGLAGALMFDYFRAAPKERKLSLRVVVLVCCSSAAFGIFDEMVQGWLDIGRNSDVADIFADCVGVLAAAFIAPPVVRAIFRKNVH